MGDPISIGTAIKTTTAVVGLGKTLNDSYASIRQSLKKSGAQALDQTCRNMHKVRDDDRMTFNFDPSKVVKHSLYNLINYTPLTLFGLCNDYRCVSFINVRNMSVGGEELWQALENARNAAGGHMSLELILDTIQAHNIEYKINFVEGYGFLPRCGQYERWSGQNFIGFEIYLLKKHTK